MLAKLLHFMKTLFITLFSLVLLAAIAVAIFLLTFDLNHYRNLAEEKLTTLLGRPVTIESMHTKLALVPTITIENFKILNNTPFENKEAFVSVKKMNAELELIPLLNSQIYIHNIDVDAVDVNLYQANGKNNWAFSDKNTTADKATGTKQPTQANNTKQPNAMDNLRVDTISIHALKILYDDAGKKQTFKGDNLILKQFHVLSGDIIYNNQTFNFSLNTGTVLHFLKQQPNFPFDLKIKSRLANISLNGRIGDLKVFSGLQATLSLDASNVKNLFAFFKINQATLPTQSLYIQTQLTGNLKKLEIKQMNLEVNGGSDVKADATGSLVNIQTNPQVTLNFKAQILDNKLTEALRIQPMSIEGDLTASASGIKSNKLVVDANRSDLTLAANIQNEKNGYNANIKITSSFLDIYDLIKKSAPKTNQNAANTSAAAQKTETTIPWNLLEKSKANLNVQIAHLWVGDWLNEYIGVTSQATLANGTLKAPFKTAVLNGQLTGDITAQASQKSIALSARGTTLNLNGIRPLQQEIQNVILETKLNLASQGSTTTSLIQNLKGKIILQANQGKIVNKWFAGLPKLLNIKKKQGVTFSNTDNQINIICAAANLNIDHGIIRGNDQIALETNTINMMAGGSVDLSQQTIDVSLQPSLPENDSANDVLSFAKMIRITGPFNQPSLRVDTKQAANDLIQTGLNKLADKVGIPQNKASTTSASGGLCQNVLGSEALVKKQTAKTTDATTRTTAKRSAPTNTKQTQQPFQQKLLNSLYEALAPQ